MASGIVWQGISVTAVGLLITLTFGLARWRVWYPDDLIDSLAERRRSSVRSAIRNPVDPDWARKRVEMSFRTWLVSGILLGLILLSAGIASIVVGLRR